MTLLIKILILCIAGAGYYLTFEYPRKRRAMNLTDRSVLTPDEFFERFYNNSGMEKEVVVSALQFIQENAALPVGRLRPSDRFDRVLGGIKELEVIDSDWDCFWDATFNYLYEPAHMKRIDLEKALADIKDVDQYIRIFAKTKAAHEKI
ncbi:MAG: hypothetical protein RDV48_30830 [Candidatus Eremiobacteraeota bacterium]|nr:hypothetical protein [Candidatus Eremiobacteraeota bacterium]